MSPAASAPAVLSAQDAGYLRRESPSQPMTVVAYGSVAPRGDGTAVTADDARRYVASRLHLAPSLRRRLDQPPLGLGRPRWVDDDRFDIAFHVRAWPGPVTSEGDVRAAIASITEGHLDRGRPLWQLWITDPLPDGRAVFAFAYHHALMDGEGSLHAYAALFGYEEDGWIADPPAWVPGGGVGAAARAVDAARAVAGRARATLGRARPAVAADGDGQLPSLLAGPVGPRRAVASVDLDLEVMKGVRRATGTTVNDVYLAVMAGGLRALLDARGPLPDRPLTAMVPRAGATEGAAGNTTWTMFVPLPVDGPDPVERLRLIAGETAARKQRDRSEGAGGYAWDLSVSNLPMPGPHYIAGGRIESWLATAPLQGRSRLAAVGLSYGSRFAVTLTADADAFPDLDVLAAGVAEELGELAAAGGAR